MIVDLDRIDWATLGIALRMELETRRNAEAVKGAILKRAARQARVSERVLEITAGGKVKLSSLSLYRVCALLGKKPETFLIDEATAAARAAFDQIGGKP